MNQQGVTFLEIVVVIAILMITSALVAPSIQDWRQKRTLEADFHAVVAQIDYLKTRARTLNGTAILTCNSDNGRGTELSYEISTNLQNSFSVLDPGFSSQSVENPTAKSQEYNLLSGKTVVVSNVCKGSPAIFTAYGQVGVAGSNGALVIELEPQGGKNSFGGFKVRVSPATGFIQKYKWQQPNGQWAEIY